MFYVYKVEYIFVIDIFVNFSYLL